jgi:hypothetical protein
VLEIPAVDDGMGGRCQSATGGVNTLDAMVAFVVASVNAGATAIVLSSSAEQNPM